jgi:excisionase family DNA binding protein
MLEANVTVREVAVKLGVTLTHVYNLVRAQRLPGAFKADGEWRVPPTALDAYLKRRQERISSTPQNDRAQIAA